MDNEDIKITNMTMHTTSLLHDKIKDIIEELSNESEKYKNELLEIETSIKALEENKIEVRTRMRQTNKILSKLGDLMRWYNSSEFQEALVNEYKNQLPTSINCKTDVQTTYAYNRQNEEVHVNGNQT